MITYKCKNCGGEMSISPAGDLFCAYCGTKGNFSDAQLKGYKEFRNSMLQYLAAVAGNTADEAAAERLWAYAEKVTFYTLDGDPIVIQYLFHAVDDGIQMYMAKESVIYIFEGDRRADAARMLDSVPRVKIPQADMKGLGRYIPSLMAKLNLVDGGVLLAFKREENMYPLEAFGRLEYVHAAWLLSRLENMCCMLEYSDLEQGGITLEGVFINPYTHEAALYGGWWKTKPAMGGSKKDLEAIRKVCRKSMGADKDKIPAPFIQFLEGQPAGDAYRDFEAWDNVIEKEMGGRHYHKMSLDHIKKEG